MIGLRRLAFISLVGAGLCPMAAWTQAQTSSDPAPVRIAMVGDLMLAETPGRLIRQGVDPLRYFASLLKQHDVRVGNLETVVATRGRPVSNKIYT